MDETYFALIGDLVASRRMEDRRGVQRKLSTVLEALQEELGDAVAAPFRLVAGDEVQGLLRDPEAVVAVLRRIGDEVHPERLVWGLGAGPVATDLSEDISLVDGPCLHRARDGVRKAGRSGRWLEPEGLPRLETEVLGALFALLGAIRADWTARELEYVREARGRSQRDVAERFGVNESTVSRGLARAHFRSVLDGEDAARAIFRSLRAPLSGVDR